MREKPLIPWIFAEEDGRINLWELVPAYKKMHACYTVHPHISEHRESESSLKFGYAN